MPVVVEEIAFAEFYDDINVVGGDGVGTEEYRYLRPIAQFTYAGNRRGGVYYLVGFTVEYSDVEFRTFRKVCGLCPQRQSVEFVRSDVQVPCSLGAGFNVRRSIRYEIQRRSRVIGMRILNDVEFYGFVIGGIARFSGFGKAERAYRPVFGGNIVRNKFYVKIFFLASVVHGFIIPAALIFIGYRLFGGNGYRIVGFGSIV